MDCNQVPGINLEQVRGLYSKNGGDKVCERVDWSDIAEINERDPPHGPIAQMVPQELFGDVVCFTVTTFDVETVDDVLFLLGFH